MHVAAIDDAAHVPTPGIREGGLPRLLPDPGCRELRAVQAPASENDVDGIRTRLAPVTDD